VNVDGSGATAITNDGADSTPAWSPDGKHLVIVKACCAASGPQWKGASTLFIVGANGNNERRLLKPPKSGCNDADPSWSPDGKWIAFDRCLDLTPNAPPVEGGHPQRSDVWLVRSSGRDLRRLVMNGSQPSWSPDGDWIVFSRVGAVGGKSTFSSLYKIRVSGASLTRLTRDPRGDQTPDW
jgi:Tol biopolymer transport system component